MKKKGSWISYLLPYILIIGILSAIILFANSSSSSKSYTYTESEVIPYSNGTDTKSCAEESVLWTGDVKSLKITFKQSSGFIDISGIISLPTDGKSSTYSFKSRCIYLSDSVDVLKYIVSNRPVYDESGNIKYDGEGVPVKYYGTYASYTIADPYESNGFMDYLPTILIFVGILLVGGFLISRLGSSINKSNTSAMDFNRSRARREDTSKVRFTDVAGCDEEKAELVELVDYLVQPDKYSKFGAKIPKGVLLVGPPGTGKTLLAKAVAGEAKVPFYSISGSDFVEMFVGVGAGRVRDMFKKAKQTAPCLIFIDEIDAVGRQRGAGLGGGNDEREQTLNQLLVEMDGFSDNSGIIVIAATNREDILDPALLRAGRFDRKITVDLPDKEGREAILKVHARNKTVDSSVDFKNIAKRTVGFSGADLENVLNEAAILAVRDKKESISTKEIDEAIDRRISGPAKTTKHLTDNEKRTVAFHEAGHAIIGLKFPHSDVVQKVTIVPRGRTGGHVLMTPEEDRFLVTKEELFARIVGYLGGRASEEIFFKDVSTGASNDIEVATKIARAMVTQFGMSPLGPIQYESNSDSVFLGRDYTSNQKNFSAQIAFEIDKEIRAIIEQAHDTALSLITEYKDDVTLIAQALMETETLNAEQISFLLNNHRLPTDEDFTPKVNPDTHKEEIDEKNSHTTEEPIDDKKEKKEED